MLKGVPNHMATVDRTPPVGTPASVGPKSGYLALSAAAAKLNLAISPEQLARDYGRADANPSLSELARIADSLGLKAKASKLNWKHLISLDAGVPVIVRLTSGAILNVERIVVDQDKAVVYLRDPLKPAMPPFAVDELRMESAWGGEALMLKMKRVAKVASPDTFDFNWMMAQVAHEKALFRDVTIAALVMGLLALVPPMLYMIVIDRVLVHHRASTLATLMIAIVVVLGFDTLLGYVRRAISALAGAKVDARVSLYIFEKLTQLPIDFFDHNSTGVISHKLGEAKKVRNFITGQLLGAVLDTSTLLILVPAMFMLNAVLASFVLVVAVLMGLVLVIYMGPVKRAYARVINAEHRRTALLIETIQGMRTVKSMALESRKRREWDARIAESVSAQTALQQIANQPQTLLAPLEKLIYAGSLCLGSFMAITDQQTIFSGTLVAFTMIATRATQPIVQLAGMMQQFEEARGAVAEVASVVNVQAEPRRANGVRPDMHGKIVFDDLRFTYAGSTTPALDGISFTVESGQVVGLMGRSGSGKTTVTRLLQGLHTKYEGLIKIDGIDLREIDLAHLRSNMGVVLQDSFLFRGTIRENILIGKPDASAADMIRAAQLAGADEFIERLPRGYETMIEEHASNLSGGQRQRLAIARALVTDPPLLVFDEATSALDPDSEAIINDNLRRIAAGRTVMVISHRLASLVDCDQILVLERGKLSDAGKHHDLLGRSEIYRHLWMQQNRHLNPNAPRNPSPFTPPGTPPGNTPAQDKPSHDRFSLRLAPKAE